MAKKPRNDGLIAENRKARYNYQIEDTLEAGVVLTGAEVKSLRDGQANIAESYASPEKDEMWLINGYIAEYDKARMFPQDERRPRKLLLKRREIARLAQSVSRGGMTVVPLKLYFNAEGRAKLLLGLAKGKKAQDKRASEKERDWNREKSRLMKQNL